MLLSMSVPRLRVGVLYGGRSSEHEVSLASAAAVLANLDPTRYATFPIYIRRDGKWSLADEPPTLRSAADVLHQSTSLRDPPVDAREVHLSAHPSDVTLVTIERKPSTPTNAAPALVGGLSLDVVFPVIHGPYGEDGTLQGLLELANVPYVGAGVLASSVAMDKTIAKVLFAASGLPVVDYVVVSALEWDRRREATLEQIETRFSYPLFVKPANLGSSVGISKAVDRSSLESAIELARQFDRKILVEVAVPNVRELECAVLGNDTPVASVPGEIKTSRDFYDYTAKYVDDTSETVIPAVLREDLTERIQTMAVKAFRAIDGAGMARVDFLLDDSTDRLYLNEVNTIPGFTTISMYSKMWEASGLDYRDLLDQLIDLALQRHTEKQKLRTSL